MCGRKAPFLNGRTAPRRRRSLPGWARWVALALVLRCGVAGTRALDGQSGEAVEQLAGVVLPEMVPTRDEEGIRLYRSVYWLWVASRGGLSPESALALAARSARRPLAEPCRQQLLADWRVAAAYGLLTPENLERMQEGLAPTATEGPFKGRRMEMGRLQGYSPVAIDNLARIAFHPVGNPPPPEALAKDAAPLLDAAYTVPALPQVRMGPPLPPNGFTPLIPGAGMPAFPPGRPPGPLPAAEPPAIRPEQVELHDVPFNDSLPLGGTRKLAVASDSGGTLSVSVIGDGPKVRVTGYYGGTYDYPRVDNTKVPRANPVHLPGVSGNAYLIHSDNTGRYYFIDTIVSNGAAFRIAKVVTSR